ERDEEGAAHGHPRAADAGEEGGRLRGADGDRLAVAERGESLLGLGAGGRLVAAGELLGAFGRARRATAEPLGGEEDQSVDHQEGGGGRWVGEERPELVLEQQADDAGRERPDD